MWTPICLEFLFTILYKYSSFKKSSPEIKKKKLINLRELINNYWNVKILLHYLITTIKVNQIQKVGYGI